jgi:hypothetical protein
VLCGIEDSRLGTPLISFGQGTLMKLIVFQSLRRKVNANIEQGILNIEHRSKCENTHAKMQKYQKQNAEGQDI